MAQLTSIKRRIKSAKNVSQITYAMQMVAASKMRRAQAVALSGRPYAQKISDAVSRFSQGTNRSLHPLLSLPHSPQKIVILISTDKGLCGGLNTSLFKLVHARFSGSQNINFIVLGKKAESFVVSSHLNLMADFPLHGPSQVIPALTELVINSFVTHQSGEIFLAYNHFVSALKQEPTVKALLPISTPDPKSQSTTEFVVEPDPASVVDALLKSYVENQIRDALFQAEASEYSARMVTMKAATDSAKDLISLLTLEYNRARQEKITSEISDIVTARLSVK